MTTTERFAQMDEGQDRKNRPLVDSRPGESLPLPSPDPLLSVTGQPFCVPEDGLYLCSDDPVPVWLPAGADYATVLEVWDKRTGHHEYLSHDGWHSLEGLAREPEEQRGRTQDLGPVLSPVPPGGGKASRARFVTGTFLTYVFVGLFSVTVARLAGMNLIQTGLFAFIGLVGVVTHVRGQRDSR